MRIIYFKTFKNACKYLDKDYYRPQTRRDICEHYSVSYILCREKDCPVMQACKEVKK